jgi:hypothetical protein
MRHNSRADEMIARARPKMEAARANGAKGGRPKKNPLGFENRNPSETHEEPSGKPIGFSEQNPAETQGETTRARSPTPYPIDKTVGTNTGTTALNVVSDESGHMSPAAVSIALIGWERERNKAARGISASNQQVIDLAAMHVTPDELRRAYDGAVADRRATDDPNPINAGFVRTFIEKYRRPAAARASPIDARDERRRRAYEVLTGNSGADPHERPDESVVDVQAKRIC